MQIVFFLMVGVIALCAPVNATRILHINIAPGDDADNLCTV
jgi:hypothetical protein